MECHEAMKTVERLGNWTKETFWFFLKPLNQQNLLKTPRHKLISYWKSIFIYKQYEIVATPGIFIEAKVK